MNLEALCALRDKLIMDPSLSTEEQTYMFGLLTDQILAIR